MFTARYGLVPYIQQISFRLFKRLIQVNSPRSGVVGRSSNAQIGETHIESKNGAYFFLIMTGDTHEDVSPFQECGWAILKC